MPTIFVDWSKNHSTDQKESVAEGITRSLVENGNPRQQDVAIFFPNIENEDMLRSSNFPSRTDDDLDNNTESG